MLFLSLLFWGFLASFVIHILDEALLGGGFVQWIVDNFWPTYRMRMFFWFNAAFLGAIAVSNMLFDSFGGHWIMLPLIWVAGFVTHALTVHLYWTIRRNTYSSALLSSLLYVIIFYLLIRDGVDRHLIPGADFAIGTTVGVPDLFGVVVCHISPPVSQRGAMPLSGHRPAEWEILARSTHSGALQPLRGY
jgi:hypothetical protein